MVSKAVHLNKISNYVDNHKTVFPMVTEIWADIWFLILWALFDHKGCREQLDMVSKAVRLIKISNYVDSHEAVFQMVAEIWAKKRCLNFEAFFDH